jgi:hypothetical protein
MGICAAGIPLTDLLRAFNTFKDVYFSLLPTHLRLKKIQPLVENNTLTCEISQG